MPGARRRAWGILRCVDTRAVLERVTGVLREARVEHALIARLLQSARDVDLDRVREYFRIFDREKELDALLAELASR